MRYIGMGSATLALEGYTTCTTLLGDMIEGHRNLIELTVVLFGWALYPLLFECELFQIVYTVKKMIIILF